MAAKIPVAQDVTAEADSAGHTDNRPLVTLLPTLLALFPQAPVAVLTRSPLGVASSFTRGDLFQRWAYRGRYQRMVTATRSGHQARYGVLVPDDDPPDLVALVPVVPGNTLLPVVASAAPVVAPAAPAAADASVALESLAAFATIWRKTPSRNSKPLPSFLGLNPSMKSSNWYDAWN